MKSLLQTHEWALVKEKQGWQTHWVDDILLLEKKLPLGLNFLYSPEVDFYQAVSTEKLAKIKEIAQKTNAFFLRLDFINTVDQVYGAKNGAVLTKLGFKKAFEEIQPEYRQIIRVDRPEEEILAKMKQKGRYNIRIAQKHGVIVHQTDKIDDFYKLFQETAERDGFSVRPKKYFEDLIKNLGDYAQILVARLEGEPIAAGIFTFYEEIASYLYGASSNSHRDVMAPYLLHWFAIQEAKKQGCKFYDLLAISPFSVNSFPISEKRSDNGQRISDNNHKFSGITRFKEQFGGLKIQTMGSWDLVLKPFWYTMFKLAEKARRH